MFLRLKTGAGEGTRTLDIFLGKEVLYQLSYTRINRLHLPTLLRRVKAVRYTFGRPTKMYQLASRHLQPRINPGLPPKIESFWWSGHLELNQDYYLPEVIGCHTPPALIDS